MTRKDIESARKTRELHSNHFDSTLGNDFAFRDDVERYRAPALSELGEECAR